MAASMKRAYGLSDMILSELHGLFSRFPEIREVWIYGSRARGDFSPASDIDLAVVAPGMSERRMAELFWELEGLPIIFEIDLLHWDTLQNPTLRESILRERKPFYPQLTRKARERFLRHESMLDEDSASS